METKKDKLTKAERLGPTRFTSQEDYEEQVALESNPVKKVKAEEPKEEPAKKMTEDEIRDLRKFEQIEMLNKLGIEEIPKYEGDRVALILKLQ